MRLGGHGNSLALPSTQLTNLSQTCVSQWRKIPLARGHPLLDLGSSEKISVVN